MDLRDCLIFQFRKQKPGAIECLLSVTHIIGGKCWRFYFQFLKIISAFFPLNHLVIKLWFKRGIWDCFHPNKNCFHLNKRLSYPCGSQFLEVISETVVWIISLVECYRWIHVSDKLWAISALEFFESLSSFGGFHSLHYEHSCYSNFPNTKYYCHQLVIPRGDL